MIERRRPAIAAYGHLNLPGPRDLGRYRFLAFYLRWRFPLDAGTSSRLLPELSPVERHRFDVLSAPEQKDQFLVSRVTVRRILSGLTGLEPSHLRIQTQPSGKPFLAGAPMPLYFNYSHSGEHLLLAVSSHGEIGADAERVGEYRDRVARRFFNHDEQARLHRLSVHARVGEFYRIWSVKEACVKADGLGVGNLQHVHTSGGPEGCWRGLWWRTLSLSAEIRAAVAIRLAEGAPPTWRLERIPFRWFLPLS